jgi:2-oxoglutarate ferredoxin oxidoreductase subunit alpha
LSAVVNDFSIQVATVNGSGSQTANSVLLRAIFQMGIPVSGKNLFPSNIAGLPTWFTIRTSRDGYVARRRDAEIVVVMNPRPPPRTSKWSRAASACTRSTNRSPPSATT